MGVKAKHPAQILQKRFAERLKTGVFYNYNFNKRNSVFSDQDSVFSEEIGDAALQMFPSIGELRALADTIVRRWLDMQPELFVDINTNRIGMRTPYDAKYIEELKGVIPAGARSWDAPTKTWYINMAYMEKLEPLVRKFFPNVKVTTVEAALPEAVTDVYITLLKPLPNFALQAIYRTVLGALHPDRAAANGITTAQAHEFYVNFKNAWAKLAAERGL